MVTEGRQNARNRKSKRAGLILLAVTSTVVFESSYTRTKDFVSPAKTIVLQWMDKSYVPTISRHGTVKIDPRSLSANSPLVLTGNCMIVVENAKERELPMVPELRADEASSRQMLSESWRKVVRSA